MPGHLKEARDRQIVVMAQYISPMSYKSHSNFGNVMLGLYSIFVGQPLHIQQEQSCSMTLQKNSK